MCLVYFKFFLSLLQSGVVPVLMSRSLFPIADVGHLYHLPPSTHKKSKKNGDE
jgi:hypothetical protein